MSVGKVVGTALGHLVHEAFRSLRKQRKRSPVRTFDYNSLHAGILEVFERHKIDDSYFDDKDDMRAHLDLAAAMLLGDLREIKMEHDNLMHDLSPSLLVTVSHVLDSVVVYQIPSSKIEKVSDDLYALALGRKPGAEA